MRPLRRLRRHFRWTDETPRHALALATLVLLLGYPGLAHAYLGQSIVEFAASNIIAPVAFLMLLVALVASFFRPELAKGAWFICVSAAVLFAVIRAGGTLVSYIQASGQ